MAERWRGWRFEISRSIDESVTLLLLDVLKIVTQLPYIIVEPIRERFSHTTHFVNEWIRAFFVAFRLTHHPTPRGN
jgi:hypothetical protein